MIKINKKEYIKDDIAVSETKITFIGVTIFNRYVTTTNSNIVKVLSKVETLKPRAIIGFKKDEIKNKSKKYKTKSRD